jgi:hypothetical protein
LLAKHRIEHNRASHGNRREKQQGDLNLAHAKQPITTIEESTHLQPHVLAVETTSDNVREIETQVAVFLILFCNQPEHFVFCQSVRGIDALNVNSATFPNKNNQIHLRLIDLTHSEPPVFVSE